MFRRCMLLMLAILLIGWGRPALALDQAEIYQAAQVELARYLGGESMGMTLDELCGLFESLGRYQKSPSFLYYASLLRDAEAERFDQLDVYVLLLEIDTDFGELLQEADFPTVAEAEAYARGRMAEAVHDDKGAIAYYQQCGAMLDSLARMRTLLLATPAPTEVPTVIPTATPAPAMQPERVNVAVRDYTISTYGNGTCVITDYTGNANMLYVADKVGGYSVTSIGHWAFRDCDSLTSITLPDGVTSIGSYAFCNCDSLKKITLPKGLAVIGSHAFSDCDSLENITVPHNVASIGSYAFRDCDTLTDVILPESVITIESHAFSHCDSLTKIILPNSITTIGDYAFCMCRLLTSMTIPDGVTVIGDKAFYVCDSLTSITIPKSVTTIGGKAFQYCPNLTLRVPQGSYAHQYAIDNNIPYTIY